MKDTVIIQNDTCMMKKDVFYLKVHKTGSCTMTLLLYRLAWSHNLSIVPVPNTYPEKSFRKFAKKRPGYNTTGKSYNILAEHLIFNEKDVELTMPKGTKYIATIRYPLAQFKSFFVEFVLASKYHLTTEADPFESFLQNLDFSESSNITHINPKTGERKEVTHLRSNSMSAVFGLDPQIITNKYAIDKWLDYIDDKFDLVLINEHFDEKDQDVYFEKV